VKFLPGDKVLFRIGEGVDDDTRGGAIEELLPRKNELVRPPVANLDQLVILTALADPAPDLRLIDRLTVFAQWNEVTPVLCFNKADLVNQEAQDKLKEAEEKQAATENENKELKEKLKDVENALSKAKKQMAGSETLTKINVLFGNVQHELSELLSALDSSDEYAELKTKVLAAISERLGAK
jgi:ribosome biogenesis GTPase